MPHGGQRRQSGRFPAVGALSRNLIRNLKTAREEREWTQEDLAHQAGIQPAEISRIEAGKRDIRLSTLEKLSQALRVPISRLLD